MALVNCPHCGKVLSDKATQCPHCEKSIEPSANFGTLRFKWKGTWALYDGKVYVTLNGEKVGDNDYYSFKKGFEFETPIKSENAEINIKCKIGLSSFVEFLECKFDKGTNYTCIISYDRFSGCFLSKVIDEDFNVLFKGVPKGWRKLFS